MNIFDKNKASAVAVSYPPYWSEWEFSQLTDRLTSAQPHLGFEITNVSHRLDLGDRVEHHNHECRFSNQLSLRGRMIGPSAEFECKFYVLPDEIKERTYHGYLTIDSCSPPDGKMYPKISARFNVRSDDEIERLRNAVQPGLTQTGSLYVTLGLQKIASLADWTTKFSSDNYSPSIPVTGMTVSTSLYDRVL